MISINDLFIGNINFHSFRCLVTFHFKGELMFINFPSFYPFITFASSSHYLVMCEKVRWLMRVVNSFSYPFRESRINSCSVTLSTYLVVRMHDNLLCVCSVICLSTFFAYLDILSTSLPSSLLLSRQVISGLPGRLSWRRRRRWGWRYPTDLSQRKK